MLESKEYIDLHELMRLRDAVTPELEQLCWYDVKPQQASFFEAALEDVPKLVRELDEFETRLARELEFNEELTNKFDRLTALQKTLSEAKHRTCDCAERLAEELKKP